MVNFYIIVFFICNVTSPFPISEGQKGDSHPFRINYSLSHREWMHTTFLSSKLNQILFVNLKHIDSLAIWGLNHLKRIKCQSKPDTSYYTTTYTAITIETRKDVFCFVIIEVQTSLACFVPTIFNFCFVCLPSPIMI